MSDSASTFLVSESVIFLSLSAGRDQAWSPRRVVHEPIARVTAVDEAKVRRRLVEAEEFLKPRRELADLSVARAEGVRLQARLVTDPVKTAYIV